MIKKFILIAVSMLISSPAFAVGIKSFVHDTPLPLKVIEFSDDEKAIHNLNEFKGKVVLINFWATWCKPCVNEMPALVQLAKNLEGQNVVMVPISIDFGGMPVVKDFYSQYHITNLPLYVDDKGKSFKAAELKALPTTLIVNKSGMEAARIMGEIDWTSKEVEDYLIKLSID
jgi:thiol-disulfide isomerase/thioredoxin